MALHDMDLSALSRIDISKLSYQDKKQLLDLLKARERLLEETKLERYKPYKQQAHFHNDRARERLFMAGNQLGKELRGDMPVLTPTGWVPIAELRVGSEVIAGDGSVTRVTGHYPQGVKPLLEIEFDYGQTVVAGYEHQWKVLKPANRWRFKTLSLPRREDGTRPSVQVENPDYGKWSVVTTEDILNHVGAEPKPKQRYATPAVGACQLQVRPLPLEPYTLGLLLGDGCLSGSSARFSTSDYELAEHIGKTFEVKQVRKYDFSIAGIGPVLRELGLQGKRSWEKFVPEQFLWNSPEVRLAVLQGLMDTDGTCEKSGVTTFSTCSALLADDVEFLARSFGGKVKRTVKRPWFTYKGERKQGRDSYQLTIRCPQVSLFRLPRQLDRYIRPTSTTDHNLIVSMREVEPAEAFCISVDHPDATYVTKDFIVTHNTWSSAYELAIHLTGEYPDWWEGRRFDHPVVMWAAGVTGESTRDTLQRLVMGRPGQYGTGTIPKSKIISTAAARGVADALDSVKVRHVSGGESILGFKSYEKGREKWQGETLHGVAFDEEPPLDIYIEGLTRTNATGGITWVTFTPLLGMSDVVKRFLIDKSPGTSVIRMTIDDAEHYTKEERDAIVASYPAHEREARAKGIPILGSGRVFPVAEESITCEPFSIPDHWPRIAAIDFGWDHPTAAVWLAWDRDTDVFYVTDCYRAREQTPVVHAASIKGRGEWIPVAWPHDGLQHDKGSGEQLATIYRNQGLNMLRERVTFEDGSNGVEAGLQQLLMLMQQQRFKVFSHLSEWFEEFRLYHRKDGKIVKLDDDLMSATRYAFMAKRFAKTYAETDQASVDPFRIPIYSYGVLDPDIGF